MHPILPYFKKWTLLQAYEFQSGYFQHLDVFACLLFLFFCKTENTQLLCNDRNLMFSEYNKTMRKSATNLLSSACFILFPAIYMYAYFVPLLCLFIPLATVKWRANFSHSKLPLLTYHTAFCFCVELWKYRLRLIDEFSKPANHSLVPGKTEYPCSEFEECSQISFLEDYTWQLDRYYWI